MDMTTLTLSGQAREELVSKTSQVQPVLSQICDYRPLSVINVLLELARLYLN